MLLPYKGSYVIASTPSGQQQGPVPPTSRTSLVYTIITTANMASLYVHKPSYT